MKRALLVFLLLACGLSLFGQVPGQTTFIDRGQKPYRIYCTYYEQGCCQSSLFDIDPSCYVVYVSDPSDISCLVIPFKRKERCVEFCQSYYALAKHITNLDLWEAAQFGLNHSLKDSFNAIGEYLEPYRSIYIKADCSWSFPFYLIRTQE